MPDHARLSSLTDYVRVIRQQRLLIVLVTLVFAGVAYATVANDPAEYEAEAALNVRNATQDLGVLGIPDISRDTPDAAAVRQAALLTLPAVNAAAQRLAKGSLSPLSTRQETRTNYVVVTARDTDPVRAARSANALAKAGVTYARDEQRARFDTIIRQAETELKRIGAKDPLAKLNRSTYRAQIVRLRTARGVTDPLEVVRLANVPTEPVGPDVVRTVVLGTLGGLVIALLIAFGRKALDRRVRSPADVGLAADLPVLGSVRREALGLVSIPDGSEEAVADSEAFNIIRTNLAHLSPDNPPRVILVTSPLPEEGKSTVAASLAVAAAMTRPPLLVECDLRRPVLSKRVGLPDGPGLAEYLADRAQPKDILRKVTLAAGDDFVERSFAFIGAGRPTNRAAQLLASERLPAFLREVSEVYDTVILDSTPLLSLSDALELVEHVDAIVLCVRAHHTTQQQLRAALAALERLPDKPTGLVMTGIRPSRDDEYGTYSYAYAAGARA